MTPFTVRRTTTAFVAVVAASCAVLLGGSPSRAASSPPWEPDANSVGGLTLYDATGNPITGGSVTDKPLAAYVEGSVAPSADGKKATLYGFTPTDGALPTAWSGEQLGSSTNYPNSSAPAPLANATLPVETGGSGDEDLADYISDFPSSDGSAPNVYQLRLYTGGGPSGQSTTYDSADIEVTGSGSSATWSVVYTQSTLPTTTTLAVSPSTSAHHGASVKLTATVSPSAATGSVKFLDGSTVLATKPVSAGSASFTTTSLTNAKHKLSATFVPTGSDYASSTSSTHTLTVTAAPTSVTVKASAGSIKKGKKLTLRAVEKPSVAGKVSFLDGSKKLAAVAVKAGKATYSTTKLKVGKHTIKATFTPSNTANSAASTSKAIKVTVKK
jgi:Bacterial Ig-like domain (group 3)